MGQKYGDFKSMKPLKWLKLTSENFYRSSNTNSLAVLGEYDRKPLLAHYFFKCSKYWCKLITMSHAKLPKVIHELLETLKLDESSELLW